MPLLPEEVLSLEDRTALHRIPGTPRERFQTRPTDAELDILGVLWKLGPATVREVHEAMDKSSAYTATLKQMQVTTGKGLLKRSERFRNHTYKPGIPREKTQVRIAGDLLAGVFDALPGMLLMGDPTFGVKATRHVADKSMLAGEG